MTFAVLEKKGEIILINYRKIETKLIAFIDLHPLDKERFCLCRHKGLEAHISTKENSNSEYSVYISVEDDDNFCKDFLVQCDSKKEMVNIFKYIVNEMVDISKTELYYDEILNILNELVNYLNLKIKLYY